VWVLELDKPPLIIYWYMVLCKRAAGLLALALPGTPSLLHGHFAILLCRAVGVSPVQLRSWLTIVSAALALCRLQGASDVLGAGDLPLVLRTAACC
jgi:hypothetical protein